ncbi:MAG TPA: porin family protein [Rhizobiales bacterium]|nr:porin family protein [Hyphomicrobiales bacterium]
MKFRFGLLAGASVLVLNSVYSASAAELPPPPPPPQYVEVVDSQPSCLYVRGDVGGAFYQRPEITKQGALWGSGTSNATDEKVANQVFIEGGVGCQVSDNMRVEVTGGYRFKSSLTEAFNGLDADLETYTGFVNAFWDITNYNGFTPYLGGGVGVAYNRLTNVTLPAGSTDGSRADLAYNLTAGLSYDITSNLKMDLAYRYVDLGFARSNGATPITVDKLRAHEVKFGMRYQFGAW